MPKEILTTNCESKPDDKQGRGSPFSEEIKKELVSFLGECFKNSKYFFYVLGMCVLIEVTSSVFDLHITTDINGLTMSQVSMTLTNLIASGASLWLFVVLLAPVNFVIYRIDGLLKWAVGIAFIQGVVSIAMILVLGMGIYSSGGISGEDITRFGDLSYIFTVNLFSTILMMLIFVHKGLFKNRKSGVVVWASIMVWGVAYLCLHTIFPDSYREYFHGVVILSLALVILSRAVFGREAEGSCKEGVYFVGVYGSAVALVEWVWVNNIQFWIS